MLSAFITDEIFAVAISEKEKLNTKYFFALAVLPYCGWTIGTVLGALAGNILPTEIQSALGIALYAMFIAIIIPPSTKSLSVLSAVMISAGLSCVFYYVPALKNGISQGIAVVICAIAASVIAALVFPVKEENSKGEITENE